MGLITSCQNLGRLTVAKRDFDRAKAAHALTYLFWECTQVCNLACRHCGSRCGPELAAAGGDLSGSEAQRIFTEIAEDFDANDITIAVTGGEPLVRRDLFDVMTTAKALGFYWGMVTNAVLITPETIDRMRASGMDTVSVSIDGDAEAHAVLRGSEAAYDKAMRGLELLIAADCLECVQVTTVVHSHNVAKLAGMYETFAAMGVGEWRLLMIDPIGRMKDPENRDLLLTGEQLADMLDFLVAKRDTGPMQMTFEESGFLGLKYEGKVRDYFFHCPAGINIGSILHDGAISACPSLERNMVQGDARTERFSDVWNTRFETFRDRDTTRRKGTCERCKWWKYCEGGSLHLWDWQREDTRACSYNLLKAAGLRVSAPPGN